MKRMKMSLWHDALDKNAAQIVKKCGLLGTYAVGGAKIVWGQANKKVTMALYLNEENGKLYFPFCDSWNLKLRNIVTYVLYIKDGAYFKPLRNDLFLLEKTDLQDYYLLILRKSEKQWHYYMELYNKERLLFSIGDVRSFKPGMDLKIIYTTYWMEKYRHWIYKADKHTLLTECGEEYSSNLCSIVKHRHENDTIDIFDKNGDVQIFFHSANTKNFYIAEEFAKTSDELCLLENLFCDDDTLNYIAKFHKNRLNDIAFMQYCLGEGNVEIGGYALYGIPIKEYYKGVSCKNEYAVALEYEKLYEPCEMDFYYRGLVKQIYDELGIEVNYYELPNKVMYKDVTSCIQSRSIMQYLMSQDFYKQARVNFNGYKKRYNEIYDTLIKNGFIEHRWKNEYALYVLLKKYYCDAIYQCRMPWLEKQSLDVYIPQLRTAFEYQGVQHYRPVDIFGGEDGFTTRRKLDEKKKELCQVNGIRLIYWRYDEPITKSTMLQKIDGN